MEYTEPYRGQDFYTLHIGGLARRLPLLQVSPDTWIAYYYSLGDTEVINAAAKALTPKLRNCEVFVTTETKGIPLTHAIATRLKLRPYVVCRKSVRPFMLNPLSMRYKPITAAKPETLYMDGRDAAKLHGKEVGIIDDILSTGETLKAMEALITQAGGRVKRRAVMLLEGASADNVIHLGTLPIFKKT